MGRVEKQSHCFTDSAIPIPRTDKEKLEDALVTVSDLVSAIQQASTQAGSQLRHPQPDGSWSCGFI